MSTTMTTGTPMARTLSRAALAVVLPLMATCWAIWGGTASAQQVLEIDYTAGRTIIDDPWRAIRGGTAIDHERGVLYVLDAEEPEGVMAFSLESGEWIRTIMAPVGDGPQELPEGIEAMSVAPDGRLYVSGPVRILEFDAQGGYLSQWTPNLTPRFRGAVCDLRGQPAVPTRNGVVRRGEDGRGEAIGENVMVVSGDPDDWETTDEFVDEVWRVQNARIQCTPNAAYVATQYGGMSTYREVSEGVAKPDSLAVFYYASNREGRLLIPHGFAADQAQTVGPLLGTDKRGHLVLLGVSLPTLLRQEGGFWDMGAVIDPESGCHAMIRNPEKNMLQPQLKGIYQDSAVVSYRYREETTENGQRVITDHSYANKVSLHPLRRVSGEPCAGMLPVP